MTAGIFHGRSRLQAAGLIDTDVTDTLTTLKNFTALGNPAKTVRLKTGLVMALKAISTLLCANRLCFVRKVGCLEIHLESSGIKPTDTLVPLCLQFHRDSSIYSFKLRALNISPARNRTRPNAISCRRSDKKRPEDLRRQMQEIEGKRDAAHRRTETRVAQIKKKQPLGWFLSKKGTRPTCGYESSLRDLSVVSLLNSG